MRAIVLAGPSVGPQLKDRQSYVLQVVLALGWGALFAYCAAYLHEDLPFPTSSLQTIGEPLIDQPEDLSRPVIMVAAAEPATPAVATAVVYQPTPQVVVAQPVVPPTTPRPTSNGLEFVGTWGPTTDACSAPSRRKGFFPATITPERAQAGDTICSFRGAHRAGNAWSMAADCGDRDHRWSSQVRLAVNGDRLTWTSAMGTSTYVRCGRRTG